jgi:hypothetical protein
MVGMPPGDWIRLEGGRIHCRHAPGGLDPTTDNGGTRYLARWVFLFLEIINRGGLYNSTASDK